MSSRTTWSDVDKYSWQHAIHVGRFTTPRPPQTVPHSRFAWTCSRTDSTSWRAPLSRLRVRRTPRNLKRAITDLAGRAELLLKSAFAGTTGASCSMTSRLPTRAICAGATLSDLPRPTFCGGCAMPASTSLAAAPARVSRAICPKSRLVSIDAFAAIFVPSIATTPTDAGPARAQSPSTPKTRRPAAAHAGSGSPRSVE